MSIFIISLLESRKRLASLEKASERADALKVELDRLQKSLRAKLALVESDEDIAIYKPIMDGIKEQIASKRKELLEAEAMDATEQQRLKSQQEQDFNALSEGRLLPEEDYQRLLQETISSIEVEAKCIKVNLVDGRAFDVPRIEGKWHSKRLMKSTFTADTINADLSGIFHYSLHIYDGEATITGGKCIMEDDSISVIIHD